MPQINFEQRRNWFAAYLSKLEQQHFQLLGAFNQFNTLLGFIAINPETHILDQIAVTIEAKGQNTAAELIEAAKQISPVKITLDVNTDNPRAIAFYKKHGFEHTGTTRVNSLSNLKCTEMQWVP